MEPWRRTLTPPALVATIPPTVAESREPMSTPKSQPALRARSRELGERHAGACRHLAGDLVDLPQVSQAPGGEHDLGSRRPVRVDRGRGAGHAAAHQARVASLGHDRHVAPSAGHEDRRDLVRGCGTDDRRRDTVEAPGPIRLVRRTQVGVDEDLRRAHGRAQRGEERGGDGGAIGLVAHAQMMAQRAAAPAARMER